MDTNRRQFLRRAFAKGGEFVTKQVEDKVRSKAKNYIRPPFALDEVDFLLNCTRCDACVEACPHHTIFKLSAKLGAEVLATPALDLINSACHLCIDYPCVSACEAGALVREEAMQPSKLAHITINEQACLPYSGPECGVCVGACPIEGALTLRNEKPVIDAKKCLGCGLCRSECFVQPNAIDVRPIGAQA